VEEASEATHARLCVLKEPHLLLVSREHRIDFFNLISLTIEPLITPKKIHSQSKNSKVSKWNKLAALEENGIAAAPKRRTKVGLQANLLDQIHNKDAAVALKPVEPRTAPIFSQGKRPGWKNDCNAESESS
jgi:hypothetical protein